MTVIARTRNSMIDGSNGDLEDLVGCCAKCGLTRKRWKPSSVTTWTQTPRPCSTQERHSDQMFKLSRQKRSQSTSNPPTSVGIQKAEVKFAVRDVTELVVDAGQQTDKGREARMNDVGGTAQGAVSAGKIGRLLRSKRCFSEMQDQKGKCMIPCDEQMCSFPMLSAQARQVDRGEIEVEEEK